MTSASPRQLSENWADASDEVWIDIQAASPNDFRELLEQPDPLLLAWLTGRDKPTEAALGRLVDDIRAGT